MSKSKEVADEENPLAHLVTSLQLRVQELEAENAKLSSQLSNCTCSEKQKKHGSSAVKGEKMARLTCSLPEELLVEILSRLPPESLLRMKCASKSWYVFIKNLVKDPTFVAKHLRSSMSSTYTLFSGYHFCNCDVITPKCSESAFSLVGELSDDNLDDQIHFVTKYLSPLLILLENYFSDTVERYHCDGIFCIVDIFRDHNIALCNPAIKEFRLLPKPSHALKTRGVGFRGVGFGHDPRANDYKVVVFGYYDLLKPFKAEVYTLTTHSWREIGSGLDVDCMPGADNYAYVKGFFYWFIWHPNYMILSFDMCNEAFQTIVMPGDAGSASQSPRLTVWNESVAVIYSFCDDEGYVLSFEIWVMDNGYDSNKGSCSWNKVRTIGPLVRMAEALAFRNDDELLIYNEDGVLCSYNIRSKKLIEIDIHKVAGTLQFWSFSYVKSLVSVQGRE
ncbi:hypothetical protein TIFTF001_030660 [Ficus carica]|uniref:F-box domain-containing protein n=1 Tax=Ficus carica TaxID=3494 RepID=A0AA88DTI5_FICCA|nr:hypothetical protein TIFTF001_030660 [Ficus carica]